jgi:hypothetical protein
MTEPSATVLPFALKDRWIVTVEGERVFVDVRHRTRWYVVARRKGYEDRAYHFASHADARWGAEQLREWFETQALAERIEAMLNRLPPIQRERALDRLRALAAESND